MQTHRLRLSMKADGRTMVLILIPPCFFLSRGGRGLELIKLSVACSLWACQCALVEEFSDSQGDDRRRFAVRRRRIYRSD